MAAQQCCTKLSTALAGLPGYHLTQNDSKGKSLNKFKTNFVSIQKTHKNVTRLFNSKNFQTASNYSGYRFSLTKVFTFSCPEGNKLAPYTLV